MKNLDNYKLKQKKVLMRVDLNVPLVMGKIIDRSRIETIKQSIKILQNQKNKIFLLSHFSRPNGVRIKKYSLEFIIPILEEEFKSDKIFFLENFDNDKIKNIIKKMKFGDICLFDNIRFYPEEENNNLKFIKKISTNFDAYVNDAFSASHRKHASIVGPPKYLPALAGRSFLKEIKNINLFINNKKKPNLAIIGGSKVSTKIDLLNNLLKSFDFIFIGGAMANTFLKVKKIDIGKSICEKQLSKNVINIFENAKKFNCEIILPLDAVCADNLKDNKNIRKCNIKDVYPNQMIFDVGEKTIKHISKYIKKSNMILWNGPLGAFEFKPFEKSSVNIANVIKKRSSLYNISVVAGGGDTISVIKLAKAETGFSYISKAGGAFLEWLEDKGSPGFNALEKNTIN